MAIGSLSRDALYYSRPSVPVIWRQTCHLELGVWGRRLWQFGYANMFPFAFSCGFALVVYTCFDAFGGFLCCCCCVAHGMTRCLWANSTSNSESTLQACVPYSCKGSGSSVVLFQRLACFQLKKCCLLSSESVPVYRDTSTCV